MSHTEIELKCLQYGLSEVLRQHIIGLENVKGSKHGFLRYTFIWYDLRRIWTSILPYWGSSQTVPCWSTTSVVASKEFLWPGMNVSIRKSLNASTWILSGATETPSAYHREIVVSGGRGGVHFLPSHSRRCYHGRVRSCIQKGTDSAVLQIYYESLMAPPGTAGKRKMWGVGFRCPRGSMW